MSKGISLQLSPNLDVSFKVSGWMGHWVSLGVVDTIVREISGGGGLISRRGRIQCALPLLDNRILLCEPGAKVSLFVCVELVLGHLVPPSRPLWDDKLSQVIAWRGGCDPVVSEHCDVTGNGSPEDDGAGQRPGVIEKALVELDKLALEVACAPRPCLWCMAGYLIAPVGSLCRHRGVSTLDCALELELCFALFSGEWWHLSQS